jgi:hypothetical protein
MIQQTLAFTADNGIPTECEILINQNILVASDRGIGVSVTNACETIATEAVRRFGLDPERLVFIEHYPADGADSRHGQPERCASVTFLWHDQRAHRPRWRHLTVAQAEVLLGARIQFD